MVAFPRKLEKSEYHRIGQMEKLDAKDSERGEGEREREGKEEGEDERGWRWEPSGSVFTSRLTRDYFCFWEFATVSSIS